MSASKPKSYQSSPATCFLRFNAEQGSMELTFRDSETKTPLKAINFVILDDDFKTISGYNMNLGKGIRSNICHGSQDFFRVSYDGGDRIAAGSWKSIETLCRNAGGRFTKQIYAIPLAIEGDGSAETAAMNKRLGEKNEIIKIDIGGMVFSSYLDACKRLKVSDMGLMLIRIDSFYEVTAQKVKKKFLVPTFRGRRLKNEEADLEKKCVDIDSTLIEEYRNYILSGGSKSDEPQQEATPDQFAADNGLPKEEFDPNWKPDGYEEVNDEPSQEIPF